MQKQSREDRICCSGFYVDRTDTIPGISGEFSPFVVLVYVFLTNERFCDDVSNKIFMVRGIYFYISTD